MLPDGAAAVFAAGHGASAMLTDALGVDLASLSVAAHLGVGNPTGEGCLGGGPVDLQHLSGSQVHRGGGTEFGSVGKVNLDPDLAQDAAGGVLHSADEGVASASWFGG